MQFARLAHRATALAATLACAAVCQAQTAPSEAAQQHRLALAGGGYIGGQSQLPRTAPQPYQQSFQHPSYRQPQYRLAQHTDPVENNSATNPQSTAPPTEHPLAPALRWAQAGCDQIRQLEDYSCTFYKRERIDGELGEYQAMFMKVRHNPFSVYMFFLSPTKMRGQEVIYVDGRNEGNLLAHSTGLKKSVVGTVSLKPTGMLAMSGNRYPVTEVGILNLTQRLIQIGEKDTQYGECEVQFFEGAKINGRDCTCIQVVHPVPRRNFLFHLARIFVDLELNVPIRYEAYDWPSQPGGPPVLTEEYTYLNLKLNNGFTDRDFDVNNPEYHFK